MYLDYLFKNKNKIFIDGGTGSEIERLGGKMNSAWGATTNLTSPEIVIKVHENFINAGCDIITTNTFASCRHTLDGPGCSENTLQINKAAVNLAKTAIKNVGKKNIIIAGCMSNFFALAKNEYRPDPKFVPSLKEEEKNYREMAKILVGEGVDFLILEMLLDIDHSKILLNVALETGLPVWVGLSCCVNKFNNEVVGRNYGVERIESLIYDKKTALEKPKLLPENRVIPLVDIIKSLTSIGGDVYGIMHSWFDDAKVGLEVLKENWSGPMMFYPEIHLFDTSTGGAIITSTEDEFSDNCSKLIDDRIKIIGGCCGVSHNHLRSLINRFN